jgi:hypothetical protein
MSTSYRTAAMLLAVLAVPLAAQDAVPAALEDLKPHEVVEAVVSEALSLGLTGDQARRLDSIHLAVRDEHHQWERQPNRKAHQRLRMKPMISPRKAYSGAMAILTPTQRAAVVKRFDAPDYIPFVPSIATTVPPSLEGLKPHRIVEAVTAERDALRLTKEQIRDLDALHVAVRDEPHRYRADAHGPKGKKHLMMEPMISQRRAYNDALSYLTADQQKAADRLLRRATYKPRLTADNQ